jgi:hypothetical protein
MNSEGIVTLLMRLVTYLPFAISFKLYVLNTRGGGGGIWAPTINCAVPI